MALLFRDFDKRVEIRSRRDGLIRFRRESEAVLFLKEQRDTHGLIDALRQALAEHPPVESRHLTDEEVMEEVAQRLLNGSLQLMEMFEPRAEASASIKGLFEEKAEEPIEVEPAPPPPVSKPPEPVVEPELSARVEAELPPEIQIEAEVEKPPALAAEAEVAPQPAVELGAKVGQAPAPAVTAGVTEPRVLATEAEVKREPAVALDAKVDERAAPEVKAGVKESPVLAAEAEVRREPAVELEAKVEERAAPEPDPEAKVKEVPKPTMEPGRPSSDEGKDNQGTKE